jgi:hypothetical protein
MVLHVFINNKAATGYVVFLLVFSFMGVANSARLVMTNTGGCI